MTVAGITVTDPAALQRWLNSAEHAYHCTAWGEGQLCCMDRLLEANK